MNKQINKQKYFLFLFLAFRNSIAFTSAQITPEWSDTTFTYADPQYTTHFDMKTDMHGNVYTSGFMTDTASDPVTKIIKYNTNGIIQWENIIDSSHYNVRLAVDTAGNVYASGAQYTLPIGLHV